MDSMRGLLSGSHDQEDGAIDAPASVGVDERRMQVRAYNYWASLLADRAYPSVEDLDLDGADFGSHSVLLDFTAGVENPGLAFLGNTLREESQIDEDVHYISQIPRSPWARCAAEAGVAVVVAVAEVPLSSP